MLLDEAAAYFAGVAPSLGEIRRGSMPDEPSVVLALAEYSSAPVELGFGFPGTRYEFPGLQVLARGEPNDYEEPRVRIERACRAASEVQAKTLSGVLHLLWRVQQSPFPLERDPEDRWVFAFNVYVWKEPSPV